jgi:hypothetical protein
VAREVLATGCDRLSPELGRPGVVGPAYGATDSVERVRERIEEERRALALAGQSVINLDLLDEQYRVVPSSTELPASGSLP